MKTLIKLLLLINLVSCGTEEDAKADAAKTAEPTTEVEVEAEIAPEVYSGPVLAKGMGKKEVQNILGDPMSTQNVYGKVAWYYLDDTYCLIMTTASGSAPLCFVVFDESGLLIQADNVRLEYVDLDTL